MKNIIFVFIALFTFSVQITQAQNCATSCNTIKNVTADTTTGIVQIDIWTIRYDLDTLDPNGKIIMQWRYKAYDGETYIGKVSNWSNPNQLSIVRVDVGDEYTSVYIKIDDKKFKELKNKGGIPDDGTFGFRDMSLVF